MRRFASLTGLMTVVASAGLQAPPANAQETVPVAFEAGACPPRLTPPAILLKAIADGTIEHLVQHKPPELLAFEEETKRRAALDWPNLCRYQADNLTLAAEPVPLNRAVFLGDSITENWASMRPSFIDNKTIVGRGIGGQVSGQILLRFQQDVVALKPRFVHIMIGTNDLSGAQQPVRFATIENNISSLVQLARANGIIPILASVPPATKFVLPVPAAAPPLVNRLNVWLREYAMQQRLVYIDYHRVLAAPDGTMRKDLTVDGIHPNAQGYAAMEPLTRQAIRDAGR